MTRVIFDISMSLDRFVTASNIRPEEPLGDGSQRLHEWAFGEDERIEHFGGEHIQLKTVEVIETPEATHLRFQVV
jgi:hypothetical protein